MEDFTIILCRPSQVFSRSFTTGTFQHTPRDLSSISAADLNKLAQASPAEWLAFSRTQSLSDAEQQDESRKVFESHPDVRILLLFSSSQAEAFTCLQNLPVQVAALRQNWAKTAQAFVFPKSFLKEHPFAEGRDPLWDLLIQTSKSPGSIAVSQLVSEDETQSQPRISERPELTPKAPGSWKSWLKSHLQSVTPEDLVPNATSRGDAIALQAGLFQIHDFLDESHNLSQSIEGEGRNKAGDYWHAIMHRREPDYGNSKYWFRHVGPHPIFGPLRSAVDALLQKSNHPAYQHARQKLLAKHQWDPFAFVDFCQECARGDDPELTRIAEESQWREMCLLLEQTYQDATA